MGMLLALGSRREAAPLVRGVLPRSIVPLFPTFYFTFGRTGWLALGAAGVLAAIAVDKRRVQLLADASSCSHPVLASRGMGVRAFPGLTRRTAPLAEARRRPRGSR